MLNKLTITRWVACINYQVLNDLYLFLGSVIIVKTLLLSIMTEGIEGINVYPTY